MALPSQFNLVTLQGRFVDLLGQPLVGKKIVLAIAPDALTVAAAKTIVTPEVRTIVLDDNGSFSEQVPATDDPDVNPTNFTYTVTEQFGRNRRYNIEVPLGGPWDLSDLAPVASSPGIGIVVGRVSPGGTSGQVLVKASAADYDTEWADVSSGVLPEDLAAVATSGSYNDLTNTPTIPTVPTLAAVATSGQYNDLVGKPSIPAGATITTGAIGILRAGIAVRTAAPCRIVFAGSSTTAGNGASAKAKRYVDRLIVALQAAYPSGLGTETTVVDSTSASFGTLSTAAGIHGYNAGEAGTTSNGYLTSAEMTSIGALNPRAVIHMIGANDYLGNVDPATVKTNVLAKIAALKAATSGPCVHILVQSYQRLDATSPAYPWWAYGDVLREIAISDPDHVAFVDVSEPFRLSGVPGSDPLALIADTVHPSDSGHALLADLQRQAITSAQSNTTATATPPPPPADTTAPSVPTGLIATPSDAQVALSWTASTDNVAVTGYKVRRDGVLIASPTATSYTDAGRTNGTSYSYTVSAVDAAGNESAQTSVVAATPTAPVTQTVLATDTFDRADAALLGTASDGKVWTVQGSWSITGNKASGTGNSFGFLTIGASDMDVRVTTVLAAGYSTTAGLSINATDANNRLAFYLDKTFNGWRFSKVDAGTLTVLDSAASGLTDGIDYVLKCISKGDVISYYINGVKVGQYTLTAAESTKFKPLQKAGIRQGASAPYTFNDFQALTPA